MTSATPAEIAAGELDSMYYFTVPSDITLAEVDESAAYYTMYFAVTFDEATGEGRNKNEQYG